MLRGRDADVLPLTCRALTRGRRGSGLHLGDERLGRHQVGSDERAAGDDDLALPVDLGPFGMPGCRLYVSMDLMTAGLAQNGSGAWYIGIPNDSSLAAVKFYVQSFAVDLLRLPAPIAVWSNAAEATIGMR